MVSILIDELEEKSRATVSSSSVYYMLIDYIVEDHRKEFSVGRLPGTITIHISPLKKINNCGHLNLLKSEDRYTP